MARSQNDMQTQHHIFLLGFMGCGKTYWGRHLAEKLSLPFLDLDDWITTNYGASIAQIFADKGDSGFRILERDALRNLSKLPKSIVATGGGTPCFFDNIDWMNSIGTTIYLDTSPTLLADRLRHEKEFRPLIAEVKNHDLEDFIANKLKEREHFYLRAKVVLEQAGVENAFEQQLEAACKAISPS